MTIHTKLPSPDQTLTCLSNLITMLYLICVSSFPSSQFPTGNVTQVFVCNASRMCYKLQNCNVLLMFVGILCKIMCVKNLLVFFPPHYSISGNRSIISGNRSIISGNRSIISGNRSIISGNRSISSE